MSQPVRLTARGHRVVAAIAAAVFLLALGIAGHIETGI